MKVIKQSAHIVTDWPKMNLYERCEFAGRISHASEDKIKEGSAEEFVRRMVKLGHESVFEFARVKFYESHAGVNVRRLREELREGKHSTNYTRAAILSECYPVFFEDILETHPLHDGVKVWLKNKDSVLFFDSWIPVIIVTNRAISHQLVRYRKDVVYLQQSQRYVKFRDDVEFIDPGVYFIDRSEEFWDEAEYEGGRFIKNHAMEVWKEAMEGAEQDYIWFLSEGYPAQAARLVLPNSTATKLIMYASPDTWRHVFEQRISDKADPMIRELLEPLKEEFVKEGLL